MQVHFKNGVHLPGPQLWLDPHHKQPFAVVSHAHADHMKRHGSVLATAATAAMMRLRGATRCDYQTLPFGQPHDLDGARLTLFPAGHVLGSSQVLVEWDGMRLLYSGDFKLRPGRSSEPVEVPHADIVVMETTFGKPRYCLPPTETVIEQIVDFCRSAMMDGYAPVLFCYSLGKGQEVLAHLHELGMPIYLHAKHWEMSCLYRDFGVDLPPFRPFEPGQKLDGVLLCASQCRRSWWFPKMARVRTAYLSGWALDAGACWRFGTDAAFPLSDHADYDDLLEYARLTKAGVIWTLHGFAREFAADLCERGYQAQSLEHAPEPKAGQLALF